MSIADIARHFVETAKFDWRRLARPNQLEPEGDWANWLILAGRGFGKTRTGAEWVRSVMCGPTPLAGGRCRHIALVAETAADARDVMVGDGKGPGEGSGILQVHPKSFMPTYESSKDRLTWPNGAVAMIYNATDPDQLRGPEHDGAWVDELAKFALAQEVWDQLQFGLRLGAWPRALITTTPKPTKLIKGIIADPRTHVTRGRTADNIANLAPNFVSSIMARYAGTRLGRQELDAELLEDTPGALWKLSDIEAARISPAQLPTLRRVVVAIDPAVSNNENSDETGIIVAGHADDGHAYIIADYSLKASPDGWAREAIKAYHRHHADLVIAEVNNGGALVEATVRMVDPNVSYKAVHASRGKAVRAEPIAALYEQRRVHHVGTFPMLEDQMSAFTSDFDRGRAGYSPDHVDALVWALTELMVEPVAGWGLIEWTRLEAEKATAPRANPNDATTFTVTLKAPLGAAGTLHLMSGRQVSVPADGLVTMTVEDSKPLLGIGWLIQNNLETAAPDAL
jgi:predicted phage terminase large subunit-like protein